MIILILLIDPFIPDSVRVFMESQDILLFNFHFLPSGDIPLIDIPVDWMNPEANK